jgi:hypothetical protein
MSTDRATLLDLIKMQDPQGRQMPVIENLNLRMPMLQDAPAFPSNAELAEKTLLRSSLPTVQFTQLNKGTVRSKGSYRETVDTIAFIDGLSEVDCRMQKAKGADAVNAWRRSEDKGFEEAIAETISTALITGDEQVDRKSLTGFYARLSALSTSIYGSQVHSVGTPGGGDTTSLLIVDWGRDGAHLIYPEKGSGVAGLSTEDKGELPVQDEDGNTMMAYLTWYNWMIGLAVKDPRHIARLANIDRSDALLEVPTQELLVDKLIEINALMPDPAGMQRVIYCDRVMSGAFHKQALNKTSNSALTIEQYLGKPLAHFMGWPIRSLDSFPATESTVV